MVLKEHVGEAGVITVKYVMAKFKWGGELNT